MKKWFVVLAVLLTAGLLFIACPTETETEYKEVPLDVVDAPASIIKSATEAYNGAALTPAIIPRDDGSFDITVKTRAGGAQTAIYFNDIWFMDKYSLVIDLPADAAVKPKRVYAFASRERNEGAPDWSRAWDSDAVKPDVTAHSGVYTIDNGDAPLPTLLRVENSTQYKAVALYLFWPPEGVTGNEEYTFTLKSLKFKPYVYAGKPANPPFITQFKVYLSDDASPWGDTGDKTIVYPPTMESPDEVLTTPIELDINTSSNKAKWELFNIEIAFPANAIGRNYEFTVSNIGAYANNDINKISTVSDLAFAHGWVSNGTATVTTTALGNGAYKVKVSNINDVGGLGVTRVYFGSDNANGNGKTWNGATNSGDEITRYTVTLTLPNSFAQ
jgi:hypothetical protein